MRDSHIKEAQPSFDLFADEEEEVKERSSHFDQSNSVNPLGEGGFQEYSIGDRRGIIQS